MEGNYCRLARNLVFPGTTSSTTVGEAAQDTMMPSLSVGKFRRQVVVATFEYLGSVGLRHPS